MDYRTLLQETLDFWEWDTELEIDEEDGSNFFSTSYNIDGNIYTLYLGITPMHLARIYLHSPVSVPSNRSTDACVLINRLNYSIYSGCLNLIENRVRYMHVIDLENASPDKHLISNMRIAAGNAFRPKIAQAIGALAFTKMSVDEIIEQFESPEESGS